GESLLTVPGGNEMEEVLMRDRERAQVAARCRERGADFGEVFLDLRRKGRGARDPSVGGDDPPEDRRGQHGPLGGRRVRELRAAGRGRGGPRAPTGQGGGRCAGQPPTSGGWKTRPSYVPASPASSRRMIAIDSSVRPPRSARCCPTAWNSRSSQPVPTPRMWRSSARACSVAICLART